MDSEIAVEAIRMRMRPMANDPDIVSPRNTAPTTAAVTGSSMLRIDEAVGPSLLVPSEKREAGIADASRTMPSIGGTTDKEMAACPEAAAVTKAIVRKKSPDESDR